LARFRDFAKSARYGFHLVKQLRLLRIGVNVDCESIVRRQVSLVKLVYFVPITIGNPRLCTLWVQLMHVYPIGLSGLRSRFANAEEQHIINRNADENALRQIDKFRDSRFLSKAPSQKRIGMPHKEGIRQNVPKSAAVRQQPQASHEEYLI
jgi:hypothetical protein